MTHSLAPLFAAIALCPLASAQRAEVLVEVGDPLPGGGTVSNMGVFLHADIKAGNWVVQVISDDGSTVLLHNGQEVLRTGDPLPADPTMTFTRAGRPQVNSSGDLAYGHSLAPNNTARGLIRNDDLLVQTGDPFAVHPFLNLPGAMVDPSAPHEFADDGSLFALVIVEGSAAGSPMRETVVKFGSGQPLVVGWEGMSLPGFTQPLSAINRLAHAGQNFAGSVLWAGSVIQGGLLTSLLFLDNTIVLQEGQSPATPGFLYQDPYWQWFSIDRADNWAVTIGLTETATGATRYAIVRNGEVDYLNGEVIDQSAPHPIGINMDARVFLTEREETLWTCTWDGRARIMRGDEPFLADAERTLEGRTIADLSVVGTTWFSGSDGRQVLVFAELDTDVVGFNPTALLLVDVPLGESYCSAEPNSTGSAARILGYGRENAADNDLALQCVDAPVGEFGYFLNSRTAGFVSPAPGSQGNLCLGGAIGRHVDSVQPIDANGRMELEVNLTALPQPSGIAAALAGETWHFQAWFRDANPTPTSNFSNGFRILFE